jgi:hypothetical protein
MNYKNQPDETIDLNYIDYNSKSDYIRPEPGYRVCTKCGKLLAINPHNFHRSKQSPDGYAYQCKECRKQYYKKK